MRHLPGQQALAEPSYLPTSPRMTLRERLSAFRNTRLVQGTLFALGVFLMVVSPLTAPLPGPGAIFVFAAGLTLVLRTSLWAKKHYVRFKRWQPKAGGWADWGLRRKSARRRIALAKEKERADQLSPECIERTDDPLPKSGLEIAPIDPTPSEVQPVSSGQRH